MYKIDLCVLFNFPLQISSVFYFLKENSDTCFLFPAAAKLKHKFLSAFQCKI